MIKTPTIETMPTFSHRRTPKLHKAMVDVQGRFPEISTDRFWAIVATIEPERLAPWTSQRISVEVGRRDEIFTRNTKGATEMTTHFTPADAKEHERGNQGYDVPDYCATCGQPFMAHTNGICPPAEGK